MQLLGNKDRAQSGFSSVTQLGVTELSVGPGLLLPLTSASISSISVVDHFLVTAVHYTGARTNRHTSNISMPQESWAETDSHYV